MVKNKVVLKERDAWSDLANFIGEMVAKYAEAMYLDNLPNPDFNRVQFEAVRSEAGLNRFVMTPTKWIEQTNAIGIVSKAGRYGGGTYAHSDIAMAFATWISPEFQLYIMKDYRRLKQDENSRFSLDWNLNRALSKVNYRIHTDAVKENLIPPELTPEQIAYTLSLIHI